jgi:hypothetical protein
MGGGTPIAKTIVDQLARARGTAVNASDPSTVAYLETLAIGRAIAAAWSTNERLANQWDALRMTDMLPRWEKIFRLRPRPTDTLVDRRQAVARAQARVGLETIHSTVTTALSTVLGPVFVAVEFLDSSLAIITVPDGTYPFGVVVDGVPWSSSVGTVLVRVERPNGYSEGDFYEAVGKISELLDDMLPADVDFLWYRAPETGASVNVPGGPSAAGFYLDERNLNESVFDV